jgi:hypothetical protein
MISTRQTIRHQQYMTLAATLVLLARAGEPFSPRQLNALADWISAHNPTFSRDKWLRTIQTAVQERTK